MDTLTPEELRKARHKLGLTLEQLGLMLGYQGEHVRSQVRKMETRGKDDEPLKPVRPAQARLLRAYLSGYRPDDWPV